MVKVMFDLELVCIPDIRSNSCWIIIWFFIVFFICNTVVHFPLLLSIFRYRGNSNTLSFLLCLLALLIQLIHSDNQRLNFQILIPTEKQQKETQNSSGIYGEGSRIKAKERGTREGGSGHCLNQRCQTRWSSHMCSSFPCRLSLPSWLPLSCRCALSVK